MKGADEFKGLFPAGSRYDRGMLSVYAGSHARGYTLSIRANGVEVFGITGGFSGWTETYGWLKRGPWEQDFSAFCEERKRVLAEQKEADERYRQSRANSEAAQEAELLAAYTSIPKGP